MPVERELEDVRRSLRGLDSSLLRELDRRAEAAREKKAAYSLDIDLRAFHEGEAVARTDSLEALPDEVKAVMLASGVDPSESGRAGSYVQVGKNVIYERVNQIYSGKLEIMDVGDALEKYPDVRDLWWTVVAPDQDKYTAFSQLHDVHGYFVRVFEGQEVELPVQSCLLLHENAEVQNVHNIVILEKGSSAHLISGCTTSPRVKTGLHIGISEFFVRPGAKLTFTMVHNWGPEFHVRPRSGALVEEGGTFISNYVLLKPVKSLQTYPVAYLRGRGSRAVFNTLIYGLENSHIDAGSKIVLEGEDSSGEAVSRAIAQDKSVVYARGTLLARQNRSRAHLDCRGIVFGDEAQMFAIPELESEGAPQSLLSHEAAIGPISEEEVEYLMARGIPRDEAVSLITRGFLDVRIMGLPQALESAIRKMVEITQRESM
ncbi:MAG TPA: SufD family Fe-S cluster assembly protein [Firmicutes bacterium]|nr:SufD family Fe-S cluster assembly protein [Candidatus Fermentithermobacillaceae bacterium]